MVIKMDKVLWKLFQKTGNINYYLLYQELRGKDERNNRRDYTK